ncbi:MAG: DUF2461 domain-containing protein [Mariprofundus sp.]|nr:DUF2461 domain-containing protein [Mariprofundus sp.]
MLTFHPHFSLSTFAFLEELAANNNRDWFSDHKQHYDNEVRAPALAFIEAVGERLPGFAPHFLADSRKTGGSLMRVYRDTRFSRDKTPYKTNIGIQFRHEAGKDIHAPGYYVHISAVECFVGIGIWHPPPNALTAIRKAIVDKPQVWSKTRNDEQFNRWFSLSGNSLKTAPRGFDKAHPLLDDLKRKDFIGIGNLAPALVEQQDFSNIVCDYFTVGTSFMRFLCSALRLPF